MRIAASSGTVIFNTKFIIKFMATGLLIAMALAINVKAADEVTSTFPPVVTGNVRYIAGDKSGVLFVTGSFNTATDFNPLTGDDTKTPVGATANSFTQSDTYVTRFEADGTYAWTKTFGGSSSDSPRKILISGSNIYVIGTFQSTDAGFGAAGSFSTSGKSDVFIWALDAKTGLSDPEFGTGGVQKFGGTSDDGVSDAVLSGSDIVLMGQFFSQDAGVGALGTIKSEAGATNYIIAIDTKKGLFDDKFAGTGVIRFGGFGSTNTNFNDSATTLAIVGSTIFVGGNFSSPNLGVLTKSVLTPLGQITGFILAFNAKDGTINDKFGTAGGIKVGGTLQDGVSKITTSGSNLVVGGLFSSKDFGVGALGTSASAGSFDVFLLELSSKDGKPNTKFGNNGFISFGGTGQDTLSDIVISKNIYLVGTYDSKDAKLGTSTVTAPVGQQDIYVLAVNPKDGTLASDKSGFNFTNFGGTQQDSAGNAILGKKSIIVAGRGTGADMGYKVAGTYKASVNGGLVIPFDLKTGVLPVVKTKTKKSERVPAADLTF